MTTEQIIRDIVDAFDRNDTAAILSYMTDDVTWTVVGHESINGKESMKKAFEDPSMKILESTKENIIVAGNAGAVNGVVKCECEGKITNINYCDIYELENGKIKKMTSYCIDKK